MREIKFRGQVVCGGGKWVYGNCLLQYGTSKSIGSNISPKRAESKYFEEVVHVCQYTNLKDANGREIYEGDILKLAPMSGKGDFIYGEVVFKGSQYLVKTKDSKYFTINNASIGYYMYVIGDVYDNKNLKEYIDYDG